MSDSRRVAKIPPVKKEVAVFVAGAAATAAGLSPLPFKEALLTAGSFLLSLAYGIILFSWRQGSGLGQTQLGGLPPRPTTGSTPPTLQPPPLSVPPPPPPPATPTPPPSPPPTELPTVSPPTPPKPPTLSTPAPPTPPPVEPPAMPESKLPRPKAPKIQLPKTVLENKVPIVLIGAGLALLIPALPLLLPPPQATGFGLLIPGAFFFGLGAILLYQRLKPRPPEAVVMKRFCMHCGFQMSSLDATCGRCHRQPPSGVDTKECPNCTAVIPALARFCRECGAGQPAQG